MAEKMRGRDKWSEVLSSTQKSNKGRDNYYDIMQKDDLRMQEDVLKTIDFTTIKNADNLYYHQAMKAPNAIEFQKGIIKEVNPNIERNHWELIPREQVPKVENLLPSVWASKH